MPADPTRTPRVLSGGRQRRRNHPQRGRWNWGLIIALGLDLAAWAIIIGLIVAVVLT